MNVHDLAITADQESPRLAGAVDGGLEPPCPGLRSAGVSPAIRKLSEKYDYVLATAPLRERQVQRLSQSWAGLKRLSCNPAPGLNQRALLQGRFVNSPESGRFSKPPSGISPSQTVMRAFLKPGLTLGWGLDLYLRSTIAVYVGAGLRNCLKTRKTAEKVVR